MKRFGFGIGAAMLMAGWVTACSSDGDGGGGDGPPFADLGTMGDTCGPTDGPAIALQIGQVHTCDVASVDPFVRFYAYPASTNELAEGQSWSIGQGTGSHGVSATWFPDGGSGNQTAIESGSIEVISISGSEAVVRYQFVTTGEQSYSGEATLSICPSTSPKCG